MRLIAAAVLAILFLAAPGVVRAQEAPPPGSCFTTEEEFIASAVNVNKAKVMVASDKARDVIVGEINRARVGAKLWPFEADLLRIGLIQHEGRLLVGIAMFKDGCVVPGSVKVVEAQAWIAFILDLGLSMDDFALERRA